MTLRLIPALIALSTLACAASAARTGIPRMEIRFDLPGLKGNPFDFTQNDVLVYVRAPGGGTVRLPAFYDGGTTWRVRYAPRLPGRYTVTGATRNGRAIRPKGLVGAVYVAKGPKRSGAVQRDPHDRRAFACEDGTPFYPIGHNIAWSDGKPDDILATIRKMGEAGENWGRVWMDHWDLKNLDWVPKRTIPLGTLDLEVARHWDAIVRAAEESGVRLQIALQHHGQFTTYNDSNWGENPWNTANGGFLASPAEFFPSPRAIALTRAKYRYIVARWGYSPNIMAWELFNEVQWTNAVRDGSQAVVARWHSEMADFLRRQDPSRHLVTSSLGISPEILGGRLDYWQPHLYVPDPLGASASLNGLALDRPAFIGEIGQRFDQPSGDVSFLRRALWGSLMSESAGAAAYWAWDFIDRRNLYPIYRSASGFVRWAGMPGRHGLRAAPATVQTTERGPLTFSPGREWAAATKTEFTIPPSGEIAGLSGLPRFLQGTAHRDMMDAATFHVAYPAPGTFSIKIGQAAKAGAHVVLSLDGKVAAERVFPPTQADAPVDLLVEIPVTQGPHTLRLENTGPDWVTVDALTVQPFASLLGAACKAGPGYAVALVYRRGGIGGATSGRLEVPGLAPGTWRVAWWDTEAGKPAREATVTVGTDRMLSVQTPPITTEAAVLIKRR